MWRKAMKFYDYEKIYWEAKGDSTLIVKLFQQAPSLGPNFIVNPHLVRAGLGYSDRTLAEYLGLCALRRYENYVYLNEVNLERFLIPPWVPEDVVQHNPLVKLTNKQLIFKKEIDLWL
jgi:hypothetical protein